MVRPGISSDPRFLRTQIILAAVITDGSVVAVLYRRPPSALYRRSLFMCWVQMVNDSVKEGPACRNTFSSSFDLMNHRFV